MARVKYVLFLCIGLLFIFLLGGCSTENHDIDKTDVTNDAKETDTINDAVKTELTEKSALDYGFAVYKIKGESIKKAIPFGGEGSVEINDDQKIDLSALEIETKPLFTDKDIEKYNWKTNTIVFNSDFLKEHVLSKEDIRLISETKILESGRIMGFYNGSKLLSCSGEDAVIITVGEERIYSSGFALAAWNSRWPPDITIGDSDTNSIRICSTAELEKTIQDKRIYDFFKKLGKIEE